MMKYTHIHIRSSRKQFRYQQKIFLWCTYLSFPYLKKHCFTVFSINTEFLVAFCSINGNRWIYKALINIHLFLQFAII